MTITRKTRLGLMLALATSALATVSGCGGSSKELSRAELIAKADPICQRTNTTLAGAKLTSQNIARVAPEIVAAERQASIEMAKLTPPSSMAADWKSIVDGIRSTGAGMQKVAEAAKSIPSAKALAQSTAFREGETEVVKGQQARGAAAARDGFRECSKF